MGGPSIRHRRGICARATATGGHQPQDPLSTWAVVPAEMRTTQTQTLQYWPAPIHRSQATARAFFLPEHVLSTLSTGRIDGARRLTQDRAALAKNLPRAASAAQAFCCRLPRPFMPTERGASSVIIWEMISRGGLRAKRNPGSATAARAFPPTRRARALAGCGDAARAKLSRDLSRFLTAAID
jgi:hypothetical protein